MEGKVVKVGGVEVNLADAVRDPRGVEDIAEDILQEMGERRLRQWDPKLNIFAHASDIAEWDDILLNKYHTIFTSGKKSCEACQQGPCDLSAKNGLCGLDLEAHQAREGLKEACRALARQLTHARDLLNYAIKIYGKEKEIDLGPYEEYPMTNVSMLCGFYPKNLADVERALSYAEAQLAELLYAVNNGNESAKDLVEKTMHAGSLTFLAMEVAETIKMCIFDFYNAGKVEPTEYKDWPKMQTPVGLGVVDTSKPVICFMGNDFLPAWHAVRIIKERGLEDEIEVCGVGAAGHDIPRFYEKAKVVTSATKARLAIRAGIPDVIVVSEMCLPFDVVEEAKKIGAKVIAYGYKADFKGVEDKTELPMEELVKYLEENDAVQVTIPEKAGELAVEIVKKAKEGKKAALLSEAEIKEKAAACKACDSCFNVCPNRLMISRAMKAAKEGNLEKLSEIYDECVFCAKCEHVCPNGLPIIDMIIGASIEKIKNDKYMMRPGRGLISHIEWRDLTFGFVLGGNGPGMVYIIGCGKYPGAEKDVAEIVRYLVDRNCFVAVAGCVAADAAKYFDEEERKYIFEKYLAAGLLRGFVNLGGCTAISHIPPATYKGTMIGSGYTPKANWSQIVDYQYTRLPLVVLIWGAATEEMFTVAMGFARSGVSVVVGPEGFKFKTWLLGNKHDRSKWQMFDGITGRIREVEPCPVHMIIPVETKEEAITMIAKLFHRPLALRDPRLASLEAYNEAHKNFFGEYSDDWHLYVRSEHEIHVMRRMEMLRLLEREHGWVIEGPRVKKARLRDGRLVDMRDYVENYGIQLGRYSTVVPRLVIKEMVGGAVAAPSEEITKMHGVPKE
ncbi:MAG: CO dehydrogenase/acetyl-CoA synthase alpha subunit [Candidatus Alkanophagales archaeon MCA70_species_1]|nr:CO dehydrogenase/acetyl-CoA synthase alpha subunit [Candidatus Alkanophaga volatiphilum]